MRIVGGIVALLAGIGVLLWKAAVLVMMGALDLLREGIKGAHLNESGLREVFHQLRQAGIPVPVTLEQWLTDWLNHQLLSGHSPDSGPIWLGLGLAIFVVIVAIGVLARGSWFEGALLALAGGAGVFVDAELSGDGWFSLGAFALAAIGGLMAMAGGHRKARPAPLADTRQTSFPGDARPSSLPRSSRPPPPPRK